MQVQLSVSAAKQLVSQSGGSLTISDAGDRLSVAVRLPRASTDRSGSLVERGRLRTALVVEDEPMVLRRLCQLVTRRGYVVTPASSVAEGLALLATDPDLLITDLQLPDGSGEDIAIASFVRSPKRPIIVCSGFSAGDLRSERLSGAAPALDLLDVSTWRRTSFAAITAAIGIAAIVSYAVRHLVSARREIEATSARELTERDRVEAEIARARRADQIAELAAEVGAEIGAALAIVEAHARALAAELPPPALDDVVDVAQSARSTMRSLTAFVPHAERASDERGNAGDVVRALPKLVRRTLPARVALEICADDDAWVGFGANDLTRICANLVLNAKDAIAGTGTIAVRVARDHERVVIDVQDDGAGMPREVLSHLFQPFFTTKPVGRGTGLGLAAARILVERAAGTIEVQSDVGRGTRFTIRLPLVA